MHDVGVRGGGGLFATLAVLVGWPGCRWSGVQEAYHMTVSVCAANGCASYACMVDLVVHPTLAPTMTPCQADAARLCTLHITELHCSRSYTLLHVTAIIVADHCTCISHKAACSHSLLTSLIPHFLVPHFLTHSQGVGPDIEVPIIADLRQRFILDSLATYVQRDGCAFEQVRSLVSAALVFVPAYQIWQSTLTVQCFGLGLDGRSTGLSCLA